MLVPFRDHQALADAAASLLGDDARREELSNRAYARGRSMTWDAVGREYAVLFEKAVRRTSRRPVPGPMAAPADLSLDHLQRMMGPHGLFQHARLSEPDPAHGFCTDDNARAVIGLTDLMRCGRMDDGIKAMFAPCLHFVLRACDFRTDRFRNFMDDNGHWLEPCGSEDSHGRALWALGHVIRHHASLNIREPAMQVFRAAAPGAARFVSPRAWAFTLLGLTKYLEAVPCDRTAASLRDELAARLTMLFDRCAGHQWHWFESNVTYDNGKLPQALLAVARQTGDLDMRRVAMKSLAFLLHAQTAPGGYFRPVGCHGFWPRGEVPAQWDQQPLEAQAMAAACLEAAAVTGQRRWADSSQRIHAWFLGENDAGIPLVEVNTGGCCDGLQEHGLNLNQGAESTLAWLQSFAAQELMRLHPAGAVPAVMPGISRPTRR